MNTQDDLDYTNEAQARVCSDGLLLYDTATFTIPAGQQHTTIPDEVIQLLGVSVNGMGVERVTADDALTAQSGGISLLSNGYYMIGRSFYLAAPAAQDVVVTIAFHSRPSVLDSSSNLDVIGEEEEAVRIRILADTLSDDRADEMASLHEQIYFDQIRLVKARHIGGEGARFMWAGK